MKRKGLIIGIVALLLGVGVALDQGARVIVQLRGGLIELLNPQKVRDIKTPMTAQELEFISHDGLRMKAEVFRTHHPYPKGTIIFIHGIRAYKEHYYPQCMRLEKEGFNTVVYDLRAHNESAGKFCTYGMNEKKDLKILIDSLGNQVGLRQKFIVWGQSLGGAVALQSMAMDPRIECGIVESTFSDLRSIIYDYAERKLGFRSELLCDLLIWRAEQIADFNVDDVVPSKSAKSIDKYIMLVHGSDDDRINIAYSKKNFDQLLSTKKVFEEVTGADHLNVWQVGGEDYFQKVIEFINEGDELVYKKWKIEQDSLNFHSKAPMIFKDLYMYELPTLNHLYDNIREEPFLKNEHYKLLHIAELDCIQNYQEEIDTVRLLGQFHFSNQFHSIIMYVLSENSTTNYLVNYDQELNYIDGIEIAGDEWAESAFSFYSYLSKDSIVSYLTNSYSENPYLQTRTKYQLTSDGHFKQVSQIEFRETQSQNTK